jgi:RNA polymerase sigma-70 factor (ECF subfamily)
MVKTRRSDEGAGLNERLARALREQRPEVIDELLTTFGRRIQGVAYLILGSRADAEEVVIDTMVTAWHKGGGLRDPDALPAWLVRIAPRQALTRRRRIGTTSPLLPGDADRVAVDEPSLIDRVALMDAMDDLPPRMRAAIVLHYFADLTVEGVAAALERSPNTVKSQLREGLARLRAKLGDGSDSSDA